MGELYGKKHEVFKLAKELNDKIRELSRDVGGTAAEVVGKKPDSSPLMPKRPNSAAGKVLSRTQAKELEENARKLEELWNYHVNDLRDQQKLREILEFDKLEALLVSLARGAKGPNAGEGNNAKSPINAVKSILKKINNNPPTPKVKTNLENIEEKERIAKEQQEQRDKDEEERRKKTEAEAAERKRQENARHAKKDAGRVDDQDASTMVSKGIHSTKELSPILRVVLPIEPDDLKKRAEILHHGPKVELNYEDDPILEKPVPQITVGYYERLRKVEQKEHITTNVKPYIHLNQELTTQELAGLKTRAASRVHKFGEEQLTKTSPTNKDKWESKAKEWDDKLKSAQKVYHEAKVEEKGTSSFGMTFTSKDSLEVGLQDKGVAVTFSKGVPSPNALVAGAEIINDAVKMAQKKQNIAGLVIKDYESNLLGGLAIFCSLACQDKPVRFDGNALAAATKDNIGYFEVGQYLQGLAKTKSGRDQLMHMIEDDNITLKTMVDWAKSRTPRPGAAEFTKQFEETHSIPKPQP